MFVQRQMYALGRDLLGGAEAKKLLQKSLRIVGLRAADAEAVAATLNTHIEARLEQAQILIERPAELREAGVIRRLEGKFALQAGRWCSHGHFNR
jgi:hypothetical protein